MSSSDEVLRRDAYLRWRESGFSGSAALLLAAALNPPWNLLNAHDMSSEFLEHLRRKVISAGDRIATAVHEEQWETAVTRAYEAVDIYQTLAIDEEQWGFLGLCTAWWTLWHERGGDPAHKSQLGVTPGGAYFSPTLLFNDDQLGTGPQFDRLIKAESGSIDWAAKYFSEQSNRQSLLEDVAREDHFWLSLSPIPDEWTERVDSFRRWIDRGLSSGAAWLITAAEHPPVWFIPATDHKYRKEIELVAEKFRDKAEHLFARGGRLTKLPKRAKHTLKSYTSIATRFKDFGMVHHALFGIETYQEALSSLEPGQVFSPRQISELIAIEIRMYQQGANWKP